MDKISKAVLAFMAPKGAGVYAELYSDLSDGKAKISNSDICSALDICEEDLRAAVAYLVKIDYAQYHFLNVRPQPISASFCLKHEGLHYKEFRQLTNREKWNERIYGFITGVLTAILVALIKSKLQI